MTGNLAKVQIIEELEKRFMAEPDRRFHILDVGITGPTPLNFWEPLFRYENFSLVGIDVDEESIEDLKKQELPKQIKKLETVSGYDLEDAYDAGSFDIVVSTQVLEHMKYPEKFLSAAFGVMKSGGELYLCYDSGDFDRGHSHLKELAKDIVVFLTRSERYHDKDVPSADARQMLLDAGYRVVDQRPYNIDPLKAIHNHEVPKEKQDAFLKKWKELEDWLNDNGHAGKHLGRYMGTYFKAVKP